MEEEKCLASNKKKMKRNSGADRISNLPESLLHEIFSSIDMKQVVGTSILSTKWRNFWKSVPDLNFKTYGHPSSRKVYSRDKEMDFVDRVILLRGDSNIRKFHFSYDFYKFHQSFNSLHYSSSYVDSSRIKTHLIFALRCCVKEIHLEIGISQLLELPPLLFTSQIEVFELISLGPEYVVSVQLPKSMCSASKLRTLKLVRVQLPQGDSNGQLVLSCPVLENLILKDCIDVHLKILNISAICLKYLVIENRGGATSSTCAIKICTPNLTSLNFSGSFYTDYFLENLSSLVSCKIIKDNSDWSLHTEPVMKVLNGVYNVSTLEIYGFRHQLSGGSKPYLDHHLNPLLNLRCLKLTKLRSGPRYCIRFVAEILKSAPCIETLVLQIEHWREEEDWGKELSLPYMFYDHLRLVKINNFRCGKNELNILKLLLKNAIVLEKVVLSYNKWTFMHNEKELVDFSGKLHSFPKASSSVTIHFMLEASLGF